MTFFPMKQVVLSPKVLIANSTLLIFYFQLYITEIPWAHLVGFIIWDRPEAINEEVSKWTDMFLL